MAYYHLGTGALDLAAQELEQHPDADRRVLRLAAASDGASSKLVQAALALPMDQGIDGDTMWTALALALRERKDPAPYLASIREQKADDAQQVLDFVTAVRTSQNPADAEHMLDGLDMTLRGHAYSAAVVLLGERAPDDWRRAANQLLFAPERPYFAASRGEPIVARTSPR